MQAVNTYLNKQYLFNIIIFRCYSVLFTSKYGLNKQKITYTFGFLLAFDVMMFFISKCIFKDKNRSRINSKITSVCNA